MECSEHLTSDHAGRPVLWYVRSILTTDPAGRPVLWYVRSILTTDLTSTCSVVCSEHFRLFFSILTTDLTGLTCSVVCSEHFNYSDPTGRPVLWYVRSILTSDPAGRPVLWYVHFSILQTCSVVCSEHFNV